MKKAINVFEYAGQICEAMKTGILLTTHADNFVNTMTIGWGMLGIEWNKPIFIAYVRESRYTKELLEKNGEFTVNIPLNAQNRSALSYCGTKSGRDTDKIHDLGIHLEPASKISVPGIQEFPITLECKVINKQKQDLNALPQALRDRFYPVAEDYHIAYYGEIVDSYIIEA